MKYFIFTLILFLFVLGCGQTDIKPEITPIEDTTFSIGKDSDIDIVIEFPYDENVITFYVDGKMIGTLYLEEPMKFEGDAEKSAELFFEYIIKQYQQEYGGN